ncbi:MAG: two-component sensor histidine kinase, partial [Bacillota bacterium]|nr:two-component sensor histidine kinase [Bacillota bacterium]
MKFKFIKLRKISWKLTIIYAFIFSLLLILLNAGILYGVKFFLTQQSTNQVEKASEITAKKILGTPGESTALTDPELLDEAQSNSDINIIITDPKGNIVNSSKNFNTDRSSILSNSDKIRKVEVDETHLVIKNLRIISNGSTKAYLQVAKNMEREYAFIKLLFIIMAIADFIG